MSSPKTSPQLGGTATARQPRPTLSAAELAALARVAAAAPSSPASRSGHLEKLSSGAAAALKDDGASTANNDATASRERLRSSMGTVFGRRWKRRFFVLHDGFLYWFAGETSSSAKGHIDLALYSSVTQDQEKHKDMHCLRLASTGKEPKFYAAAETPEELKLWIEVIKRAIVEVGGEAAAAVPSTSASAASPGSLNRIRSTLSRTINRMSSMSSVKAAGAAATASTDNVVASNASIASSLSNAERAEREQTPTRGQSRLADLATAAVEDGSAAASQKQQRKASTVSFKAQAVASEAAKESASGKDGSTNDDGDVFQSAVPSRTNSNARPIPSVATSMPLTPVKPAARRSRVMTILRISVNLIALVVMVLAVAKGLGFDVDPIRRVVLERVDEARAWTEGAVYDVRKLKDNVVYDVSKWTDDVVYDVRTWTEDVVYDVRTWKDAAAYDAWIWTDAVKHDLRKRSDDVAYDVRIWTDTMLYNLGAFIERQASYLHSSTATFRRGLTAEWTLLCKHFDRAANSIYSAGEDVIVWLWHVVHGVFVAAYDLQQALLTKVQDVVLKVRTFV